MRERERKRVSFVAATVEELEGTAIVWFRARNSVLLFRDSVYLHFENVQKGVISQLLRNDSRETRRFPRPTIASRHASESRGQCNDEDGLRRNVMWAKQWVKKTPARGCPFFFTFPAWQLNLRGSRRVQASGPGK